jgi:hypothetical protein
MEKIKAEIKYTVKYHARPLKKVANVLFGFAGLIIVLLDLIWTPFKSLTPDFQALAVLYIIPNLFWHFHAIALLSLALGGCLWLFRWRAGKIELTDDKLIIEGSYFVSIWLKNMWEVDIRDMQFHKWIVRLDSNVDAVQIKFKTEKEFEDFSEKLIHLVAQVENIKLKTST